jgi:hypothetical protein
VEQACYRELRKYKYELKGAYALEIPITGCEVRTEYIDLESDGLLTIKDRYAWDGATNPARDTPNVMRASLVHDALYQLMRLKELDPEEHRKTADEIFRDICLEDGMGRFRAGYSYLAVRWFGGGHARKSHGTVDVVVCVPPER